MGVWKGEIKTQDMYVDALSEGSRTRVRFPPPPPDFASDFRGEVRSYVSARHQISRLVLSKSEVCRAEATEATSEGGRHEVLLCLHPSVRDR